MSYSYGASPRLIAFSAWLACLQAMMVRGMVTRFSGGLRGYVWVVLTPVTWILAITLFFVFLGRAAPISVNLPAFIATGMLPYLIFRQGISAMLRAEALFRHVLVARVARVGDVFAATAALEAVNAFFLTGLVLGFVALVFGLPMPQNVLAVFIGLMFAWALGATLGLLLAAIQRRLPDTVRLTPILLRPFFWISGIFFLAHELPEVIRDALWWNPLLHIVELTRDGFFSNFESAFFDIRVPLTALISCFAAAKLAEVWTEAARRLVL